MDKLFLYNSLDNIVSIWNDRIVNNICNYINNDECIFVYRLNKNNLPENTNFKVHSMKYNKRIGELNFVVDVTLDDIVKYTSSQTISVDPSIFDTSRTSKTIIDGLLIVKIPKFDDTANIGIID